jgi:hypothetical protein
MPQIILLLIALLLNPVAVAAADTGYCGHTSQLARASSFRLEAARQIPIDPALADEKLSSFGDSIL